MKPRFNAIVLIVLCLLVQAVSVYPHHHHANAPCTSHDREASLPVPVPQNCTAGCITHFNITLPTVSHSVREIQKTPILYKVIFRTEYPLPLLLFQNFGKRGGISPAILYSSPPIGSIGLRAPPSSFFPTQEE